MAYQLDLEKGFLQLNLSYKNTEELEIGNEMNDVLDENIKFEFLKIE